MLFLLPLDIVAPSYQSWGFPDSSVGKESSCNIGDPGSIPGLGRLAGAGIGYTLQYSWAPLWLTWWRICLQCRRLGFDPWVGKIPWRRERLPTPVLWPGEFYGLYNPWGCRVQHHWATFTFTSDLSMCTGTMFSLSSTQAPTFLALNHWPSYFPACWWWTGFRTSSITWANSHDKSFHMYKWKYVYISLENSD